jgi:hypothetical protein
MITKEKYISRAKSFLGVCEGTPRHKEIIMAYNSIKPLPRDYKVTTSDAWCAAFVSAVAQLTNFGNNFPYECSVQNMVNIATKNKMWVTDKTPVVGWLCIYDWQKDGHADHVGIVTKVNTKTIEVLEGNYKDSVRVRNIAKNAETIKGFIALKYSDTPKGSNETIAREVIDGKWGNGEARKKKLIKAGYDPDAIQKIVNKLLK